MVRMIQFTKMHGAGNDYIYVNTMLYPVAKPEQAAIRWSAPHTGVGSDGLVLIGASGKADFSMHIFNADGSEAKMCGNASRCIGKYIHDNGLSSKEELTLETLSGIKVLHLHLDAEGHVANVTVDMGEPHLSMEIVKGGEMLTIGGHIPLSVAGVELADAEGFFVSMGNPHLVIFVPDVLVVLLSEVGARLEHHPYFPGGVNVEFAQVNPDGTIRMRVWERGSGITQACGTGACATAVAAALTDRAGRTSEVVMDGGTLAIEWRGGDNHVYMTGPAVKVFDGTIEEGAEE